jgi:hypothetical protein
VYDLPEGVTNGVVRLLFQTAFREFIEFLRDNNPNPGDPENNGQILYDLWTRTERNRPETMVETTFGAGGTVVFLPGVQN